MDWTSQQGGVRALWAADLPAHAVALAWLGQAGFALRIGTRRLLIDPYLSDSLAAKYHGQPFPHTRMMAAPIAPHELCDLDFVLCTHRHSDHMDPGTLPLLAAANPQCRFIVPAAEIEAATRAGIPRDRQLPVNAGQHLPLDPAIHLHVLAAAHEQLQTNERGEHHYLGFIFELPGLTLYHSGDCVVYAGLAEQLQSHAIDWALLPVNGRDEFRRSHGVPGNMNFSEAAQLCRDARIPALLPHHFGMFDFNTIPEADLRAAAALLPNPQCLVPAIGLWYLLQPRSRP